MMNQESGITNSAHPLMCHWFIIGATLLLTTPEDNHTATPLGP